MAREYFDLLYRPIRVVVFGSGPELTHDAQEFLVRLEQHPDITLLEVFCQSASPSSTWSAILKDLWRRRRILAIPLFFMRLISGLAAYLRNPRTETNLKRSLRQLSNRIHSVPNIHAPEVIERIRRLEPDLGLIYGSPILKPELFEIPLLGTLGIHHGKVPAYRGNKTTFWAIYNGEEVAGVTIQKINAGLDTGSIVKEAEVLIGDRAYATVWSDLEAVGLDLYIQAILEVKNGTATYRPQIGKKGKLYRNPTTKDFIVFWLRRLKRRLRIG